MGNDDPDRAAILARRQRFIALALSGLATTACDKPNDGVESPKGIQGGKDDGARPQACLDVAPPRDDGVGEEGSTGKPMPCLEVVAPPDEDDGAPPQACLKIAAPDPEPEPEPRPHACLRVKAPEPRPQPCLNIVPVEPKPEPEPRPQPCLKVAKPKGA